MNIGYYEFTDNMGLFTTKEALLNANSALREITILDSIEDWRLNILDAKTFLASCDIFPE